MLVADDTGIGDLSFSSFILYILPYKFITTYIWSGYSVRVSITDKSEYNLIRIIGNVAES